MPHQSSQHLPTAAGEYFERIAEDPATVRLQEGQEKPHHGLAITYSDLQATSQQKNSPYLEATGANCRFGLKMLSNNALALQVERNIDNKNSNYHLCLVDAQGINLAFSEVPLNDKTQFQINFNPNHQFLQILRSHPEQKLYFRLEINSPGPTAAIRKDTRMAMGKSLGRRSLAA